MVYPIRIIKNLSFPVICKNAQDYRAFCQVAINDVKITIITIDVLVIDIDFYMWIEHPFVFSRCRGVMILERLQWVVCVVALLHPCEAISLRGSSCQL